MKQLHNGANNETPKGTHIFYLEVISVKLFFPCGFSANDVNMKYYRKLLALFPEGDRVPE